MTEAVAYVGWRGQVTGYGMEQALERAHGLQLMNAWPSESENAECYAAPANQNTVNKRPPFTYFGKAASTRESMQVSTPLLSPFRRAPFVSLREVW